MPVKCSICDKGFATQSSCNRHVREVHQKDPEPVSYSSQKGKGMSLTSCCLEPGCCRAFKTIKDLVKHLQNDHSMKFEFERHVMESMNEFEDWKASIEVQENCYYVLKSKNSSTLGEIIYYKCNRSKTSYTSKDQSGKLLKSQGICKMNNSCTSEIKVTKENFKINVEWQKVHYGHKTELQHIRLPKMEKQKIATDLLNGVVSQRILESTRDNIGDHLKRVDLLTLQDIRNIKVSYGLELTNVKRDSKNTFSVALWVQECEQLKENPILFYKEQDKEHRILKKDDFCLIIMNAFQKQMIKQFPSTIAIDSTHDLSGYDFEMTTIMVIDEDRHSFPVAEMFTNRKDSTVQSLFFSSIKDAVGAVHCKYFMSDMTEVFFNAWCLVMGAPYPEHLFCCWHVDRAWQSNLSQIHDKEKKADIYKILKVLQEETPESNFNSALENALSYMRENEITKHFGEYFANTYSHNFMKWAYCFQKDANINTNMHLESMHKVIKYFYLDRKNLKRLDKGLNMVLKYVRDKCVERVIRLSKGEHTEKTRQLSKNHQEALEQTDNGNNYSIITPETQRNWSVTKNENNVSYNVQQIVDTKSCEQMCLLCEACNRMFSCDCKYFYENRKMCKHIHIIIDNELEKKQKTDSLDEDNLIREGSTALSQDQQISHTSKSSNNLDQVKLMASQIKDLDFDNLDNAAISKIHYHLSSVNKISKCSDIQNKNFVKKKCSNKRYIEPQIRYTSTKKKRIEKRRSLKRASAKDTAIIKQNLNNVSGQPIICKLSSALNDHQYL